MERANLIPMLFVALAFLCGSIPFGVFVARRIGGVKIQEHGSGNIGATNVARVLGAGPGLAVLALDAGKGALPVWLASRAGAGAWVVVATAAAAILGHCFSPFLKGKGGKGVATAFGAFLVLAPALAGAAVLVFAIVLALTRVPALGSLAGVLAICALAAVTRDVPCTVLAAGAFFLMIYTHRTNLAKLTSARRAP